MAIKLVYQKLINKYEYKNPEYRINDITLIINRHKCVIRFTKFDKRFDSRYNNWVQSCVIEKSKLYENDEEIKFIYDIIEEPIKLSAKKEEFLKLYKGNISSTCRQIGIHSSTYYKWLDNDKNFFERLNKRGSVEGKKYQSDSKILKISGHIERIEDDDLNNHYREFSELGYLGWVLKNNDKIEKQIKYIIEKFYQYSFYLYENNVYCFDDEKDIFSTSERILLIKEFHYRREKKFTNLKKEIRLFENLVNHKEYSREPIPEDVRFFVWRRDQGRCVKCGSKKNLEFDHIIPISEGGSNSERNIQLLCQECNRKKSNKI